MKNNNLKIADFGISNFLTATLTTCQSGTPAYQAPEIWNGKGSNFKSDVWSVIIQNLIKELNRSTCSNYRALGVSFYQICTGYLPFIANDTVRGYFVNTKPTPELPNEFQEYNIIFKK